MVENQTISQMQEFNPKNEMVTAKDFNIHIGKYKCKLVLTVLTVVGSTHYSLIRGLLSPELPKDKSFKDLGILKKQYDLESIIIVEQFHFYE